ncbi:hypothetical protein [Myroides odoratimimus]|uniref:hypothetical protein n=1 Tax=Myroides odoratimimus TaxID=76832 RepID=UPI003D9C32F1
MGVKGELYYEKEGVIYKITVDSTKFLKSISYLNIYVEMRKGLNEKDVLFNSDEIVSNEEYNLFNVDAYGIPLQPLISLFFTIYMNYSIYSLDEIDYKKESHLEFHHQAKHSWLSSIVHKNDGYQTPLAIHPNRKEGNIIIRNEKILLKQRLSSLVFVNDKYRNILSDFYLCKVQLSKKENYLNEWFENIFSQHYELDNIEDENYYSNGYEGGPIKKETIIYSKNLQPSISQIEKLKLLNLVFNFLNFNKELFDYFNFIPIENRSFYEENTLSKVIDDHFKDVLDTYDSLKIDFIKEAVKYFNKENVFELIKICWLYSYLKKQDRFKNIFLSNQVNLTHDLISYFLVKALKILQYDKYNEHELEITLDDVLDFNIELIHSSYQEFIEFVNKISTEDDNHLTIKMNQCLSLLAYISISPKNDLVNYYNKLYEKDTLSIVFEIDDLKRAILKMQSQTNKELVLLLPPSIFKYDFMSENQKDSIDLDKISSGQFQKIALLSSISYHLKNIDSIKGNDQLENIITSNNQYYSYENILIILDEIELYAHPDQQRVFISDLIDILRSEKFNKITNINIVFVTHSPFILSDIPSQNVLKLDEGKVVKESEVNSFGANIHDLLAGDFFLENNTMGKFASSKIDSIIKQLYMSKTKKELDNNISNKLFTDSMRDEFKRTKEKLEKELCTINNIYTKKDLEDSIKLIGEPLLARKLKEMYDFVYKEG